MISDVYSQLPNDCLGTTVLFVIFITSLDFTVGYDKPTSHTMLTLPNGKPLQQCQRDTFLKCVTSVTLVQSLASFYVSSHKEIEHTYSRSSLPAVAFGSRKPWSTLGREIEIVYIKFIGIYIFITFLFAF